MERYLRPKKQEIEGFRYNNFKPSPYRRKNRRARSLIEIIERYYCFFPFVSISRTLRGIGRPGFPCRYYTRQHNGFALSFGGKMHCDKPHPLHVPTWAISDIT